MSPATYSSAGALCVRSRSVLLALLLVVSMSACHSSTPSPVEDLLGTALSDLTAEVDTVLLQLGDTANAVTLQLGGQIRLDIDQATSAYADLLTKTVNSLDASVKQTLNQFQSLVDELASQAQNVLATAMQDAELLLSQIPFTNKNPRVTNYSPPFTTAAEAAAGLVVTLSGAFVHADEQGYAPVLKVNGMVIDKALASTKLTALGFRLPPGAFAGASPDVEVDLPYDTGHLFNKKVVPGIFHIYIPKLPDSPVQNVNLSTTTRTTRAESRTVTTQRYDYSSLDCKIHGDTVTLQPPAAAPGATNWTIDTTTVAFHVVDGYPKGPSGTVTGPNWTSISPAAITFTVQTTPNCPWPLVEGGRTHFTVSYTIVRTVDGSPAVKDCDQHSSGNGCPNLALQWGGSFDAPVPQPPGDWHLLITLFNGTAITAGPGATSDHNPFVTITDLGTHVHVSATALTNIPTNAVASTGTH